MSLRSTAAAFVKEGGIGLAVMVLLVLLVWLGGDYLGVAPVISQSVIVGVVCVGVALFITRRVLARRQAKRLATKFLELAAEDADATLGERKARQQEMAALLREGVAHLRMSEHGERAVSELPWYLVIGPTGAGKSTLMEQSGLAFAQMGRVRKPVSEAGETRDLDWWLAQSAVFLDVPGRYISSHESPFEWAAFVGALKEARAQAPVSGVVVVISLPEILELKNDEIEPWAKNIRDRLDELSAQCRWVFPVYVAFSKLDCLAGFAPAFGALAEEQRRQAWGATLPFKVDENRNYRTIFHDECNRLSEPLREQVLAALAGEAPPAEKEQAALFPRQVFLAQRRMGEVLGAVFRPNPFIETGLLRGFYFASARQGGIRHDLIRETRAEQAPRDQAPFFVSQLFTDVLPPDRHLARLSVKERKRRRALATAVGAGAIAASVLLSAIMLLAFADHQAAIERVVAARANSSEHARMEELRKALIAADAPRTLARAVPLGGAENRVVDAARGDYAALALKLVVQPATDEIQRRLAATRASGYDSMAKYDAALGAAVALHMLAGHTPLNGEAVRPELVRALRSIAGGDEAIEAQSVAQIDYLLASPAALKSAMPRVDSALLEAVDSDLKGALWEQAAWLDIVREAPVFSPVTRDSLIAGAGREFLVMSEVPGFYTQRGYDGYVAPAIKRRAAELAQRLKALGQEKPAWSIAASLTDRYADEHAAAWARAQRNFATRDFEGLAQCAQALKRLTGADSVISELLQSLRTGRALKLADGTVRNSDADDLKWLGGALAPLATLAGQIETVLSEGSAAEPVLDCHKRGKLDALVAAHNDCARAIIDALALAPTEQRPHYQHVFDRLLEGAARELCQQAQAECEQLWLGALAGYAADVAPYFPFHAQSQREAPLNTVARLFNPKSGRFTAVVVTLEALRSYTITVGLAEQAQRLALVRFSAEFEAALARLRKLQDAWFGGGETMLVKFRVSFARSPGVDDVSLACGKATRSLNDPGAGELSWAQESATGVKLQARLGGAWAALDYATQDWGLVRLVAAARRAKLDAARTQCTWRFTQGAQSADVTIEFEFLSGHALEPEQFSALALPEKVGP